MKASKLVSMTDEAEQLRELSFRVNAIARSIYDARTRCEIDDMMDRLDHIEDDLYQIADDILDIVYERES